MGQTDIIMIAIDLGKLGAVAQGRHDHIEMAVPHATLQLQGLQGTCDSLRENPKGLRALRFRCLSSQMFRH